MHATRTRDLLQPKRIATDSEGGRLDHRPATGHAKALHLSDRYVHGAEQEVGLVSHVVVAAAAADIHIERPLEEQPVAGGARIARPAEIDQQVLVGQRLAELGGLDRSAHRLRLPRQVP